MSRRALMVIAAAAAMAVGLPGCSSAPVEAGPPTYQLPPETARPDEVTLRLPVVKEDDAVFSLIGLTTDMASIFGSHAEFPAKGSFTRIRVVVTNTARTNLLFDTRRQQLITGDGVVHSPDEQAMTIKRQPDKFELGANVRVEFDLYYDIPKDQRPVALRVFGGGSPQDQLDTTGTDIQLGQPGGAQPAQSSSPSSPPR